MKRSSISLSDLESVRPQHEKALKDLHTKVMTYKNLTTHSEAQFNKALGDVIEIYEELEKASLGVEERRRNLAFVIEVIGYYYDTPFSLTRLGTSGITTIITLSGKYGYNLYGSLEWLRQIKQHDEDPEFVASLQRQVANEVINYVETHEQEKADNIRRLRERYPHITKPIVYASGSYRKGTEGRAEMVSAWGELLQSKLLFLNMSKESLEKVRQYIDELPLKPSVKSLIAKEIKERSADEIFSGCNLNLELFVENLDGINRIISRYLERHGRHRGCIEVYEWEGLFTELYAEPYIGIETFYNPKKVDYKIKYANARLEPLGLGHIRYSEERVV